MTPSPALEAALRVLLLSAAGWALLRLCRIRHPEREALALRTLILGALAMPFLMQFSWLPVGPPELALPAIVSRVAGGMEMDPFTVAPPSAPVGVGWNLAGVLLATWAAGVLILVARLGFGLALALRLWRGGRSLPPARVLGLRARESHQTLVPVTIGSGILLPADWEHWSVAMFRSVLLHECEHVRRGDFYWQVVSALHRALFWFNPVAWWTHRRLVELAEDRSDAVVIERLQDPVCYAEVLLEFGGRSGRASPGVAMSRPASLSRRIESILNGEGTMKAASRVSRLSTVSIFVVLLVLAAGITLARGPHPPGMGRGTSTGGAAARAQGGGENPAFSYVFVNGSVGTMSGDMDDYREAKRHEARIGEPYVWFRMDRRAYLVTDEATLDRLVVILDGPEQSSVRMEQLSEEMNELSDEMERLSAQISELSEDPGVPVAEVRKLVALQVEVAELQSALAREQGEVAESQSQAARTAARAIEALLAEALKNGVARAAP